VWPLYQHLNVAQQKLISGNHIKPAHVLLQSTARSHFQLALVGGGPGAGAHTACLQSSTVIAMHVPTLSFWPMLLCSLHTTLQKFWSEMADRFVQLYFTRFESRHITCS
jgi:hypothetical protein